MFNTRDFGTLLSLYVTTIAIVSAYFEGDGTTYTLGGVSSGNCNLMSWNSIAPTNYAALNNDQWDNMGNCGRCAQVSCIDSRCADPTATAIVQIVDRCPECTYGGLDLSPTVFSTITGSDPSRLAIQWQFVDCPNPGTIKICLKSGSNGLWIAVQPTNSIVGVQSVKVDGQTATMLNDAYYYLVTSSTQLDLTAVNVVITSVNSDVIDGTYPLTPGQCTDTHLQFSSTSVTVAPTTVPPSTTIPPTTQPPATTAPPDKCYVRRNRN